MLIYGNAQVKRFLAEFTGDIVPDADGTRDLGDPTHKWAEIHQDLMFIGATSLNEAELITIKAGGGGIPPITGSPDPTGRLPQILANGNLEDSGYATSDFDPAGTAAASMVAHLLAGDPHPQYLTPAEGDAAYQPLNGLLTDIAAITPALGSLIIYDGGDYVDLPVGTPGQILQVSASPLGVDWRGHIDPISYIQFNTAYADGSAEARLQWHSDDGTLELGMPGGNVNLQIGQEHIVRARNTTGDPILNGSAVYVIGSQSGRPLIAKAVASSSATGIVMGVATETIGNNSFGYVTIFGLVRDMDTSAIAEGGTAFLSESTPGALRATPPAAPNLKSRVGWCIVQDGSSGMLLASPSTVPNLASLSDVYATPGPGTADGDSVIWRDANSRFEMEQAFLPTSARSPHSWQLGDLLSFDGADWMALPLGLDGQALVVSGSPDDVSWGSVAADYCAIDDSGFTGWGSYTSGLDNLQGLASALDNALGNLHDFYAGIFLQSFDALVTSDGATVTMSIEKVGGGDLQMIFSTGNFILDCTPADTIALTAGTDAAPTTNFIYIPRATQVLTKSLTQWPAEEHIKVGYFLVPSAAEVQAEGCYINQNWNDHSKDATGQGHYTHITETIRLTMGGASWHSGVNGGAAGVLYLDITGTSPSTVYYQATAGICYQMHKHTIPAIDTDPGGGNDDAHVVNWNGDPYHEIRDFADIVADANGASLSNKFFNLVIWGVANKGGEYTPVMVNLPTGSYTGITNAERDIDGYDVTDIPHSFIQDSTTGFLICRLTCKQTPSGTWTLESTTDLRGTRPGTTASGGGGGGTTTDFSDNQFSIYNISDVSKIVDWDLSGLSTGNTRTVTPADAAMTLLSTVNHDLLTTGVETTLHIHDGRYFTETEINAGFQPLSGYLTDIAALSPAIGGLIVFDGADFMDLPHGAVGQVLTVGASPITLEWATPEYVPSGVALGDLMSYDGGAWSVLTMGTVGQRIQVGGSPLDLEWVDEEKAFVFTYGSTLATGDNLPWVMNKFAHAVEITGVYGVMKAGATGEVSVEIEKCTQSNIDGSPSWVSIFTTVLTIDLGELSSATAAVAAVLNASTKTLAPGDHLRMRVTGIGTDGADLTVFITGKEV